MTKVGKSDGEGTFPGTRGKGEVAPLPAYSLNRDRIAKPDPQASCIRGFADGRSGRLKPVTLIEIAPPRHRRFSHGVERRQSPIRHLLVLPDRGWATLSMIVEAVDCPAMEIAGGPP